MLAIYRRSSQELLLLLLFIPTDKSFGWGLYRLFITYFIMLKSVTFHFILHVCRYWCTPTGSILTPTTLRTYAHAFSIYISCVRKPHDIFTMFPINQATLLRIRNHSPILWNKILDVSGKTKSYSFSLYTAYTLSILSIKHNYYSKPTGRVHHVRVVWNLNFNNLHYTY